MLATPLGTVTSSLIWICHKMVLGLSQLRVRLAKFGCDTYYSSYESLHLTYIGWKFVMRVMLCVYCYKIMNDVCES